MNDELKELVEEILSCKKCPLHKTRKKPVPGEGKVPSDLMLVGEAPGRKEDEEGRPFVGNAGKLLTRCLLRIGISRSNVYITNIVKCRPPNNRTPTREEISSCIHYLVRQINIVRPKVIVALGSVAATYLCTRYFPTLNPRPISITRVRGTVFTSRLGDHVYRVVPTFHPAAILRRRGLEDLFVQDLLKAKELLKNQC